MILVHSSFLPSGELIEAGIQCGGLAIDRASHFVKQTPRNRCRISGPNGPQYLIIPVKGRNKRQAMEDVLISYDEPWQRQHIQALQTAYSSAPYFEYLMPELASILEKMTNHLIDLNNSLLDWVLGRLHLHLPVLACNTYLTDSGEYEEGRDWNFSNSGIPQVYPQVFQEKNGFIPNCSLLDRMMNELEDYEIALARLSSI